MAHSEGSTKVVLYALLANFGIAVAKFFGAYITKSASMLAEGIHSLVDCTNQALLLWGAKASQKPPDEKHPLGYGREAFFWSFVVAILLFSLGGLFAIYEGVHKLHEGGESASPMVGVVILAFAILLEGFSFVACLKEVKRTNPFPNIWVWVRKTTSADLLVIFFEDLAALLGLVVAFVFLVLAWVTGDLKYDAIGSICIGVILITVAFVLAVEVKSLLIGEASGFDYRKSAHSLLVQHFPKGSILNLISLQTGGNEVMLSMKFDPGEEMTSRALIDKINSLEVDLKSKHTEIRWQFIEPDYKL